VSSTWPHQFNVHTTERTPFPEFGGDRAMLYTSPDRRRIAGSFREQGKHHVVQPFDEFIFVIEGSARIEVEGYEPFDMAAGDCCWLKQGDAVTFEMHAGFLDVAVLVSDKPIEDL
jgi:uncharacterized cupin superfamily protein